MCMAKVVDSFKRAVTRHCVDESFVLYLTFSCWWVQNPDNFFNENEQLAFCPALIVPGAQASSACSFTVTH